jgi:sarcosine oxidase
MRVAVIGCGAMGAAAAWRLKRRGADVVAFDRFSPPHDRGSSHGDSRIIRTAYMEGAFYVPLLREVFPLWRELERETGADLLTITGLLTIGAPESHAVKSVLATAREQDVEVQVLEAAEVRRRFPGHVLTDDECAVLDPEAGYLLPEKAIEAMTRQVDLRRDTPVRAVEYRAEGVDVVTAGGTEGFDAAVVATGPWIRELVPGLPVQGERQPMVWLALQSDADWFGAARFPVWLREGTPQGDAYGFPSLDGRTIKIGLHHGGDPADPDTLKRSVTDADLDPIRLFVTRYLRGVTRHVARSVVCIYTNSPDDDFIVDLHPESSRVVVLSPCSGHGFKFAPVIGDVAADLVLQGRTARDISRFALSRFGSARRQ